MIKICFNLLLFFFTVFFSFGNENDIVLRQLIEEKKEIKSVEKLALWADDVDSYFTGQKKTGELAEFLGETASAEKNALFSSYLYFRLSDIYWLNDNKEIAVYYMTKIDENAYNIIYDDKPIGYLVALRIISYECNFKFQEKMYKLLLEKYPDKIDVIYTMNDFAKMYKKNLDIQNAINLMQQILVLAKKNKNVEETINLSEIKQEVDFFYLKKDRIYKDIRVLIKGINKAIKSKNIRALKSYISRTGFDVIFFQKSNQNRWNFDELSIETHFSDNIMFSDRFEDFSNENEIYLRTDNWDFPQMTTWYFYFKRVDYPYDEKIDGGWEWKGIFFGDFF